MLVERVLLGEVALAVLALEALRVGVVGVGRCRRPLVRVGQRLWRRHSALVGGVVDLQVGVEFFGGGEEAGGGRWTETAPVEVGLAGGVDEKEVLFEQAEVVEELHLLAEHAAVDFDAVVVLEVVHVVG